MDSPAFLARWKLGAPTLVAETIGSKIWRATREDGTSAIVKAMKPVHDVHDELRGAHYLRWRDGRGAVRLLDIEGLDMLLEDAGAVHLTQYLDAEGDRAATDIAAGCLAELFSASSMPAPHELQPLGERFTSLFTRARADCDAGVETLYVEAASEAARLLASQRDVRPLHGDLHHDNIMLGARGWLAIDPKGVIGDSAYDAANFFYNPIERDALSCDPERVAMMADVFSARLGIPQRHLLDFAFAYGCLSAAWFAEDGMPEDEWRELAAVRAVRDVRLSA